MARVSAVYDLTEAQLRARGRSHHIAEARAMIAWMAILWGSATLTVVGQRFGRDVATLSITVRRLQERAKHSEALQACLASLGVEVDL